MHKVTDNAQQEALYYAWDQLRYLPFDQGDVKVVFDHEEREMVAPETRNDERPMVVGTYDLWRGEATIRREEGGKSVWVQVREEAYLHRVTDARDEGRPWTVQSTGVYIVEVDWSATDCDGKMSGGHVVKFRRGVMPEVERHNTRDHQAEAAGY